MLGDIFHNEWSALPTKFEKCIHICSPVFHTICLVPVRLSLRPSRSRYNVYCLYGKPNSPSDIVRTMWKPVTRIYTSIFVASPPLTIGTVLPAWILYGAMECPLRFLMGLTVQKNKTVKNSLFWQNSPVSQKLTQDPCRLQNFSIFLYSSLYKDSSIFKDSLPHSNCNGIS